MAAKKATDAASIIVAALLSWLQAWPRAPSHGVTSVGFWSGALTQLVPSKIWPGSVQEPAPVPPGGRAGGFTASAVPAPAPPTEVPAPVIGVPGGLPPLVCWASNWSLA